MFFMRFAVIRNGGGGEEGEGERQKGQRSTINRNSTSTLPFRTSYSDNPISSDSTYTYTQKDYNSSIRVLIHVLIQVLIQVLMSLLIEVLIVVFIVDTKTSQNIVQCCVVITKEEGAEGVPNGLRNPN